MELGILSVPVFVLREVGGTQRAMVARFGPHRPSAVGA